MSIIYDALKKAEKNVAVNAGPEQPKPEPKPEKKTANEEKKVERKLYLVYILIICLTLFLANAAYNYLTSAKNKSLFSLSKIFPNKKPKPTPYSLSTANKPAAPKPAPYINAPAATPGSDSGNVTSQNVFQRGQPRSAAASSNVSSIFSSVA